MVSRFTIGVVTGSLSISLGSIPLGAVADEAPTRMAGAPAANPANPGLGDSTTPRVVQPVYLVRKPLWTATTEKPADAGAEPAAVVEIYAWVANADRLDQEAPKFEHRVVLKGNQAGGSAETSLWNLTVRELEPAVLPPVNEPDVPGAANYGVWKFVTYAEVSVTHTDDAADGRRTVTATGAFVVECTLEARGALPRRK